MTQQEEQFLPRILIIDDLYGRKVSSGVNQDRRNLCGKFLLSDVTERNGGEGIQQPIAEAVFFRGQKPECASVGDVVENDLDGCLQKVREGWNEAQLTGTPNWSMVLLDLCFYTGKVTETSNTNPGMPQGCDDDRNNYFGIKILQALHRDFPDLPVVIFSSMLKDERLSREIFNLGVKAFLPRDTENYVRLQELISKYALVPDSSGLIIGCSLPLLKVLRDARLAALETKNQNFLVLGETGVGKELLAKFLHDQSPMRKNGPFIPVNSATLLNSDMALSALFGIDAKRATGVSGQVGAFKQADKGDLFLDEIADLPHDVQAAILRTLQEGVIQRHGSSSPSEPIDVRVISATNADLQKKVSDVLFRNDLLQRLNSQSFMLPPLRERVEDIPLLARHFFRMAWKDRPQTHQTLTQGAIDALIKYKWPGNVRELYNVVFTAVAKNTDADDLHENQINPVLNEKLQNPTSYGTPSPLPQIPNESTEPTVINAQDPSSRQKGRLAELERALKNAEFEDLDYDALDGFYTRINEAYAELLRRYILRAMKLNRKPKTKKNPNGDGYEYTGIGKLLTGNPELDPTNAGRLLRRILKIDPKLAEFAQNDDFLKEFAPKTEKE